MSSFINKAKDKIEATLEKNSNKNENTQTGGYGTHGNTTADSSLGGYGNNQPHDQYGTAGATSGMTSTSNYGSNMNNPGFDNSRSTNDGPHSSNLMNKTDPRVDSDRDGRNDPTSRYGGVGNTQTQGDNFGQPSAVGGFAASDAGYGASSGTHTTGHTGVGTHGLPSSAGPTSNVGYTGGSNTYDDPRSTNTGPHGSNVMNRADPRVDSDLDNRGNPTSRVGGYGGQTDVQGSYGTTGGYGVGSTTGAPGYGSGATQAHEATTTGHGTHQSHGAHGAHGAYGAQDTYGDSSFTPGSGNAQKTAGPHNSDMMNKIDPRVDSDLDGSKTYGGNRTNY